MNVSSVRCALQQPFRVIPNFDSELLSNRLAKLGNIHRFLISAEKGSFEFLLAYLPSSGVQWMIFSDEQTAGFTEVHLSLLQKMKLHNASDEISSKLYYLITNTLSDIQLVTGSNIWVLGSAIALPIKQFSSEIIQQAIAMQVGIYNNQTRIITDYGCFLLSTNQ